jgi:hypothetical protein
VAGNRAIKRVSIPDKASVELALFFLSPSPISSVALTEKNLLHCLLISLSLHALAIALVPVRENTGLRSGDGMSSAVMQAQLRLPQQQMRPLISKTAMAQNQPEAKTQAVETPSPAGPEPATKHEGGDDQEDLFGLLIPAEVPYVESATLSERPQVLEDVPPTLNQSLQTKESGYALLKLRINEQGRIDEVIIEASDLGDSDLQHIREAFKNMQFAPGRIGHTAVKTDMRIQVSVEAIRKVRGQP